MLHAKQHEAAGVRHKLGVALQQVDQYRSTAEALMSEQEESKEAAVLFKEQIGQQLDQMTEERNLLGQQLEASLTKIQVNLVSALLLPLINNSLINNHLDA